MHLDRTNLRVIEILQKDARTSLADLARLVNRAESTVRERVGSLETRGVLTGYRAVVDYERLGYHARAIVHARIDLRRLPELVKRLESIPQVTRVLLTTGPLPLVIEAAAPDLPAMEEFLEKRLAPLELEKWEVSVVVRSLVEERPLALSAGQPAPEAPVRLPAFNGHGEHGLEVTP